MGRHSKTSTTRRAVTAGAGVLGLMAALTGSAAGDPLTPLTCIVAPGDDCPEPQGAIDARIDVGELACTRTVVAHEDGRVLVAGQSIPCPDEPVAVIVPDPDDVDTPTVPDGLGTAPPPRTVDTESSYLPLPKVQG